MQVSDITTTGQDKKNQLLLSVNSRATGGVFSRFWQTGPPLAASALLWDDLEVEEGGLDVGRSEAGEFSSKPSFRCEVRAALFFLGGEHRRAALRLQPFSSPSKTEPRTFELPGHLVQHGLSPSLLVFTLTCAFAWAEGESGPRSRWCVTCRACA